MRKTCPSWSILLLFPLCDSGWLCCSYGKKRNNEKQRLTAVGRRADRSSGGKAALPSFQLLFLWRSPPAQSWGFMLILSQHRATLSRVKLQLKMGFAFQSVLLAEDSCINSHKFKLNTHVWKVAFLFFNTSQYIWIPLRTIWKCL